MKIEKVGGMYLVPKELIPNVIFWAYQITEVKGIINKLFSSYQKLSLEQVQYFCDRVLFTQAKWSAAIPFCVDSIEGKQLWLKFRVTETEELYELHLDRWKDHTDSQRAALKAEIEKYNECS